MLKSNKQIAQIAVARLKTTAADGSLEDEFKKSIASLKGDLKITKRLFYYADKRVVTGVYYSPNTITLPMLKYALESLSEKVKGKDISVADTAFDIVFAWSTSKINGLTYELWADVDTGTLKFKLQTP